MVKQPPLPYYMPAAKVKTNDAIDTQKPMNEDKSHLNEHIVKKKLLTKTMANVDGIRSEAAATNHPLFDTTSKY